VVVVGEVKDGRRREDEEVACGWEFALMLVLSVFFASGYTK